MKPGHRPMTQAELKKWRMRREIESFIPQLAEAVDVVVAELERRYKEMWEWI